MLTGLTATIRGACFLISLVIKDILNKNKLEPDRLVNGGQIIGQLERGLIFLFIFIEQPAAIDFLVMAKSIFRFKNVRDQKLAEYILIGTLLSFSTAIASCTYHVGGIPLNEWIHQLHSSRTESPDRLAAQVPGAELGMGKMLGAMIVG